MASQIVEIVGPAGAGKTTLYHMLGNSSASIQLGNFPDVRKMSDMPFFLINGLELLPVILRLLWKRKTLTRREFAWLCILHGWSAKLRKEFDQVIVLDQGPVYLLAEMQEFGSEYLRGHDAERLWDDLYIQWAATLDSIIWLDAKDIDLAERIRARRKEHALKYESTETASVFLSRYRKAYKHVIFCLSKHCSDLRILHFDTSQKEPREITAQLMSEFDVT